MKKNVNIFLILSFIFLCGCSSLQLFEINSQDVNNSKKYFEFENDSIRIIYDFYSESGTMSFLVTNKLKVPLYIDWKKSSFIMNEFKNNYWDDVTEIKTIGRSVNFSNSANFSNFGLSHYYSISDKPERITFIPPATSIPQHKFLIYPNSSYSFNVNPKVKEQNLGNGERAKVYFETYDVKNSPIKFRNFLTFSNSEKFETEFHIDNSFYVYQVNQFKRKFLNKLRSPKSFYILNESMTAIEEKKFADPLYYK